MASVATLSVPPALDVILRDIAAKHGFRKSKIHVTSGSGAGDGYSSTVYRATIADDANQQKEALSLICKTSMPLFRDTMSRMYQIEAYTYEVLLPAMENIAHLTDPLPWPRCEFADVQGPPPHTLVLLDMRPEGFVMADRSVFMDEAHCRLALKQLARFHGAGLALKHLKPDHFEEIKKRLNLNIWDTVELRANMKPYNSAMVQVPHVVQDKFPEGSDIQTRLKKLFGAFKEDSIALMGPLAGPGYTIIHNDLHVNNMMYQYDKVTNAVTDCRLIDFQMSVYGLPALDIVTILLVCTEKPMRDLHWDSLLQGYHQELLATLSGAGCSEPEKLFPWTLLQDQLKEH